MYVQYVRAEVARQHKTERVSVSYSCVLLRANRKSYFCFAMQIIRTHVDKTSHVIYEYSFSDDFSFVQFRITLTSVYVRSFPCQYCCHFIHGTQLSISILSQCMANILAAQCSISHIQNEQK